MPSKIGKYTENAIHKNSCHPAHAAHEASQRRNLAGTTWNVQDLVERNSGFPGAGGTDQLNAGKGKGWASVLIGNKKDDFAHDAGRGYGVPRKVWPGDDPWA